MFYELHNEGADWDQYQLSRWFAKGIVMVLIHQVNQNKKIYDLRPSKQRQIRRNIKRLDLNFDGYESDSTAVIPLKHVTSGKVNHVIAAGKAVPPLDPVEKGNLFDVLLVSANKEVLNVILADA